MSNRVGAPFVFEKIESNRTPNVKYSWETLVMPAHVPMIPSFSSTVHAVWVQFKMLCAIYSLERNLFFTWITMIILVIYAKSRLPHYSSILQVQSTDLHGFVGQLWFHSCARCIPMPCPNCVTAYLHPAHRARTWHKIFLTMHLHGLFRGTQTHSKNMRIGWINTLFSVEFPGHFEHKDLRSRHLSRYMYSITVRKLPM